MVGCRGFSFVECMLYLLLTAVLALAGVQLAALWLQGSASSQLRADHMHRLWTANVYLARDIAKAHKGFGAWRVEKGGAVWRTVESGQEDVVVSWMLIQGALCRQEHAVRVLVVTGIELFEFGVDLSDKGFVRGVHCSLRSGGQDYRWYMPVYASVCE